MNYKEKLDRVFSEYIRLRDSNPNGWVKCYCCGKIIFWNKGCHNMHFIPRQHLSLRFNEKNCHAGCVKCNSFNNGNIEEYVLHLMKDYGIDIIQNLRNMKHILTKISDTEYKFMISYYQNEVKKLKQEKSL